MASAQNQLKPLVLFVVDEQIGSASPFDVGAEGVTALTRIFTNLGADVLPVTINQPLPNTVQVVVIARPLNTIPIETVARLWAYMESGHNLLLAVDPQFYNVTDSEQRVNNTMLSLLNSDYGTELQESFLVERWSTREVLNAGVEGSLLDVYPFLATHPVIQPLQDYALPVTTWGTRTIRVEPFGINSIALPLLYTETAYGETNPKSLSVGEGSAPLEINFDTDLLGQLNVAALAKNIRNGSYVVMLGDSQMLLDGFGMLNDPDTALPQHVGNRILVERLAALLMDIPVEEWPGLPQGFTWLMLDGDTSDWGADLGAVVDEVDGAPDTYNIQQARAFQNDSYIYLLIETSAATPVDARLELNISSAEVDSVKISAQDGQIVVVTDTGETLVEDGSIAFGRAVEVRLPLRVTGLSGIMINDLCLYAGGEDDSVEVQDCLSQPLPVTQVDERDPVSLRFGPTISATIANMGRGAAELRDVPDIFMPVKALINNGTVLAVKGRDESGEWINVQNARIDGWVEAFEVIANGDLTALPIVP